MIAARAFFGILFTAVILHARPALAGPPTAPGLHDLVVFDPGMHERGLPKVVFDEYESTSDGACQQIEIPPTVHVHRYYYSGDKEIQGPIINGGPTMIVARHPKTGKQMYVDAVLPSGAPKIAYTGNCITYVYPDQRVCIHFRHFPFNPEAVDVTYHSGRGLGREISEHMDEHMTTAKQHWHNSAVVESVKSATDETCDALKGVGSGATDLVKQAHASLKAAAQLVPGVTPLLDSPDNSATSAQRRSIEAAASRNARTATQFVPTIR